MFHTTMRRYILFFAAFFVTIHASFAVAETDLSAFRETYRPQLPELQLPQVVNVTLPVQDYGIAVVEDTTGTPQPWVRVRKTEQDSIQAVVTEHSALIGLASNLTDGDYDTAAEFDLDADGGEANVMFESVPAITSSQLRIALDQNVALPREIEISAWVNDKWKTVLAQSRLRSSTVVFPETTATKWQVKLWHIQPLRLRELQLVDAKSRIQNVGEEYVWLARPGESYTIYADAAVYTNLATGESGNLLSDQEEIIALSAGSATRNSGFQEPDSDEDGVANMSDNCVTIANPEQTDLDNNGRGDACEDHDKDGVMDDRDNCPAHANRYQRDTDGDGIGDVCDGEESRVTERMPWLPWVAMVAVAIVIGFIVFRTIRDAGKRQS